jgi:hypothetical protein
VTLIKPLFAICTLQGILASDLMRVEAVIDEVAASLAPGAYRRAVAVLHDLYDAKADLGFCLLNQEGLARLTKLEPDHNKEQTPYIPPRIWTYQLNRLRECLQDFNNYKKQIENYGSLKAATRSISHSGKPPFQNRKSTPAIRYHGAFKLTADRFGITNLIEKWTGEFQEGKKQIAKLSRYLDLVTQAGLAYLINFSLMRIEEGYSLRSDCLLVEHDATFGDIPILVGETTKTTFDSNARWPVSKSAPLAVEALKHIARLRMLCACEREDLGITEKDKRNPYLISYQYEPWSRGKHKNYRFRPIPRNYKMVVSSHPNLFDPMQITITEEDARLARLITPTLNKNDFKVGKKWPFAWHQLRRTGAVNMQASKLIDDSSVQLLMKHHSRVMMLYYGRNHSRLALNEDTRTLYLTTMYQEIARNLHSLSLPQFLSPAGEARKQTIVSFVEESDVVALEKAARRGAVGARRIRAGFCVNHRPCPYGGIEAIAHCLGGDDGKGCPDLLQDVKQEGAIRLYEKVIDDQLNVVHPNSPRYQSLQAEKRAAERFHANVHAQIR